MSAPFGTKISTDLYIIKPYSYHMPFFDAYFSDYINEVKEIIKPVELVELVVRESIYTWRKEYFARDIPIETGIKAIKLFAEKVEKYNFDKFRYDNGIYSPYVGILKINNKEVSFDDIDKYFANIYDRLEKSLLREYKIYKNKLEKTGQFRAVARRSIYFYVRRRGKPRGRLIVSFTIFGELIDLF